MSTSTYIIIGVIVLVVLGGFLFLQQGQAPTGLGTEQAASSPGQQARLEAVVAYTDNGYSPRETAIAKGGIVEFRNESSRDVWPATAIHPTHTVYPGSDIQKCATEKAGAMFDACGPVAPGQSWSFTFQEIGTWGYHDHLNVSYTGRITVE